MNPLFRTSRNPIDEKKHSLINPCININRPSSPFLMIGEKIDRKLTKAYQSLRQQSSKPQTMHHKDTINHPKTQRSSCNRDGLITIRLKRQKMMSSINSYDSPLQPNHNSIVLIDNSDVMEYIHEVYANYGIKDPLEAKRNLTNQNRFQTIQTKKLRQIDCSTQAQSLQSARTNKDSTDSIVQISQFNIQQSQISKTSLLKRSKKILITLRPKTHSKGRNYSNEKQIQSKIDIQQLSAPTVKCKQKEDRHQDEQLPRIRYCFACERPIISQKIMKHQQQCLLLKLAYTYSYEKILNILHQKITRLTSEVQRQIIDVDSRSVYEQFQGIKQSTKQMMNEIDKNKIHGNKFKSDVGKIDCWKGKYKETKMSIDANFSNKFLLISKLGWFVSLRDNLLKYCDQKIL